MKVRTQYIRQHYYLLFGVLIVSLIQAAILVYWDIGQQVVSNNIEQLTGIEVPRYLILNHLNQLGIVNVIWKVISKTIPLLLFQCIPALIYGRFQSVAAKLLSPIIIWLVPAIIGLPTVVGTVMYLMSPLVSIIFFVSLGLDQANTKEDFAEGIVFVMAVVGWFNLFWLGVTIKNWFFLRK